MKRTILALGAITFLVLSPVVAEEATREEVLDSYYEAIGGLDAWSEATTIKLVGKMTAPNGMEAPLTILSKAPNKARIEFVVQGMTGVQAVDGEVAWQIMPFMGKTEPEPMPEELAKPVFEMADFDGPLVNWKEDGNEVEYLGIEDVEGTATHKLEITLGSGDVRYIYLDSDYYLPIKSSGRVHMQGQEMDVETIYGDYKEVAGLMLPHSLEQKPVGAPVGQVLIFDTAEVNVELADDQFSMPTAEN